EDGIRDLTVTGVQTCALPISEAREEFSRAITLVEQVMRTMSIPQQWRTFLRQYAELYAQQAITLVRLQQDAQALTQAQSFADIRSEERRVGKGCRRGCGCECE